MKLLLLILFVIFPFGHLLPPVNDLVIGVIGVIGVIRGLRTKSDLKKPVFLWVGIMVFSLFLNFKFYTLNQNLVASLYLLRWVAYAGIYFFFLNFKDKVFLKKGLIFSAMMVALVGITQYLLMPDVSFFSSLEWDNHYFRLIFPFMDPGFTGAILVLGLLVTYNPLIFVAMLLTYSRASFLMYTIGYFFREPFKKFIVAMLILIMGIYLLPITSGEGTKLAREASIWARFDSWGTAIKLWQKSPVYGVGFNTYRYAANQSLVSHAGAGSDASILNVLATTGVLGMLGYLGVLGAMFKKGGRIFRASLLAVFVHSWFNNTLFYPWVMEWLWLLLILDS